MPLKKVKSKYKTAQKALQATPGGVRDYNATVKAIQKEAGKAVGNSGSRVQDVKNAAKLANKLKKERGVSLKKSIKNRMK